jgi:hypothetical protein
MHLSRALAIMALAFAGVQALPTEKRGRSTPYMAAFHFIIEISNSVQISPHVMIKTQRISSPTKTNVRRSAMTKTQPTSSRIKTSVMTKTRPTSLPTKINARRSAMIKTQPTSLPTKTSVMTKIRPTSSPTNRNVLISMMDIALVLIQCGIAIELDQME